MNARIAKQFSMGFSVDATYTWSKSIDMLSAEGPGAQTNQTDPVHAQTDEYGPCDYDSRHRFVANGLWTLPIFPHNKGWLHAILGGWQLGGILTAYSGFPWTLVTGYPDNRWRRYQVPLPLVRPGRSSTTTMPTRTMSPIPAS